MNVWLQANSSANSRWNVLMIFFLLLKITKFPKKIIKILIPNFSPFSLQMIVWLRANSSANSRWNVRMKIPTTLCVEIRSLSASRKNYPVMGTWIACRMTNLTKQTVSKSDNFLCSFHKLSNEWCDQIFTFNLVILRLCISQCRIFGIPLKNHKRIFVKWKNRTK